MRHRLVAWHLAGSRASGSTTDSRHFLSAFRLVRYRYRYIHAYADSQFVRKISQFLEIKPQRLGQKDLKITISINSGIVLDFPSCSEGSTF